MKLPKTEHTRRAWRIHEIAPDFRVEDVWAFRTPGAGPDDFGVMLAALREAGGPNRNPPLVRFLFTVRWKLGALFGWDEPRQGLAERVRSLRDRLPRDLRETSDGVLVPNTPFTAVYELHDEAAYELANRTVHDILHLGWVRADTGDYELRMAALVKPNGLFGRLYMAAIVPFRYLIVYPALTRQWERAWRERTHHHTMEYGVPGTRMIRWAGWLIVFYGAAHTLGALTMEGAARHAEAWFRGELWKDDLANMSPANSAYWLSVDSFGVPLIVVGLIVLWLDSHGITPPPFIAWMLGGWTVVDAVVLLLTPWPILLLASVLLLVGVRRAGHHVHPTPRSVTVRTGQ